MTHRILVCATTVAGAVAGVAGCAHSPASGPASGPAAPAATSTSLIGGMTTCTKDAVAPAATGAAQALGPNDVYTVEDLQCADGWAVTAGVLADKADPTRGAPTSFVFEQEGQFWVLQDKAKVCGTNPTTTTAPSDATIPAALFLSGCAAG